MTIVSEIFEMLQNMGFEIGPPPMPDFSMLNARESESQLFIDRIINKEITMNEFKIQINQTYIEEKKIVAVSMADQFLKSIFEQIKVNLSGDVLAHFRTAIINDQMIITDLVFNEMTELVFNEINSCNLNVSDDLNDFIFKALPEYTLAAHRKYLVVVPQPHTNLMEMLSHQILRAMYMK